MRKRVDFTYIGLCSIYLIAHLGNLVVQIIIDLKNVIKQQLRNRCMKNKKPNLDKNKKVPPIEDAKIDQFQF